MMPNINTGRFVDGSALTEEQGLLMKRILVELLSGQGVSGRKVRLTTKP